MIKKLMKISSILLLSIFSFYYTEKSIEIVRNQDPIMKKIKNTDDKYNISAVNAKIEGNTIIPGKTGKTIDYESSYTKMKQYGNYNEILIELKDVKPTISVEDHYDKFIISGYYEKKSVALIFKVDTKNPTDILNILNKNETKATFFIDGVYLETNYNEIQNLKQHQLELLSYNNDYDELHFSSSKSYLETLTNKKLKYCYSEYDKKEVITLCEKLKLHTIIPTIQVKSSPFKEIKEQLRNSAIISIPISEITKQELDTTIKYIKSRGYKLETLDELLNENYEK